MNEQRNMFSSFSFSSASKAVWSDLTVGKSVKEGYKLSGWVYRAVSMIGKSAGQVPWMVRDIESGEWITEHHLHMLLQNPHPHFSRQDVFELLAMWLQLSGNGYLKKVKGAQQTKELWPTSPDRLRPIALKDSDKIIGGYERLSSAGVWSKSQDYDETNTIHFKLLDPSNPLIGIGPLSAAARAVDLDNSQQEWNQSLLQNRGVPEGVFTFKEALTEAQFTSIMQKIKDKFLGKDNARKPLVIGGDANYQRLSITPAEVDFLQSRKFNREEIYAVFGVPPQLGGSQESSTYNNFSSALRIFWEGTVIPLLDDIKDTLNNSFEDELDSRYEIAYDTSNIDALRETENERLDSGKKLYEMGVPMNQISSKYNLGIDEYDGWDKPFNGLKNQTVIPTQERAHNKVTESRKIALIPTEKRNFESEQKRRDALAENYCFDRFRKFLSEQQDAVFAAIDDGNQNPVDVVKAQAAKLSDTLNETYRYVAGEFVGTVTMDERSQPFVIETRDQVSDQIQGEIDLMLGQDAVIAGDLSGINSTTVNSILGQLVDASEMQKTVQQIKDAIMDSGVFSPERALRIARTTAGTAASIGQLASAKIAGATMKRWETSAHEVRDEHAMRSGEKVDMNARFSNQSYAIGPRFPLDPQADVADRVNCRCSMTFAIED